MMIVQLIGALVGAVISVYVLTGFVTLLMCGGLKGINGSDEDLTIARNAMWFRASIVAFVTLAAVGVSQVDEGGLISESDELIGQGSYDVDDGTLDFALDEAIVLGRGTTSFLVSYKL